VADFTELARYLAEQIDIGTDRIVLDEPWAYRPVSRAAPPVRVADSFRQRQPVVPRPSSASNVPAARAAGPRALVPNEKIVIPESAKAVVPSAFESATDLESFYGSVAAEKIYAKSNFAKGEGNLQGPRLLLVIYAPIEKYRNGYLDSDVGQMVARMFESLQIASGQIGITYFCKKPATRAVLPQVAILFKKMLEKEVSLVNPQTLVFFGDRLLKQALSQNARVIDFGGVPLEFAKVPATVLIDPEEMLNDRQLKVITWKTHIPKCGFFG